MKKRLLSLSLGLSMIFTNVTAIHAEDSLPSKDSSLRIEEKNDVARKNTSEVPQSAKLTETPTLSAVKAAQGEHRDFIDIAYYFDFETDPEDNGWVFVDADGDGYNWEWTTVSNMSPFEGEGLITSESYNNDTEKALYPDNWAVSPKISVGSNYVVSFMAMGQDPSWASENFAVYAIPVTSDAVPAPDAEWVKIGGDFTATGEYVEYVASLAAFAGQDVRIAIRHYNISDMFMLNVDAFTVGSTDVEFYSITFDLNNGTGETISGTTGLDGTVALPSPEYEGYSFLGWFTDPTAGEKVTEETVFTEDTILYAHWIEIAFGFYFETDPEQEGWVFVDSDGDGYNWYWTTQLTAYEGSGMIISQSYSNDASMALFPDNWAISPKFSVGEGGTAFFMAKGQDPSYAAEKFAVYAIPVTSDAVPAPDAEWVKIGGDFTATGSFVSYSIDLNDYAGKDVRVAIRHYDVTDMFILDVDAFEFASVKPFTITFDPNGGTVEPAEMTAGIDGTLSTLPTPTRSGFVFAGWFTELDGGEEVTTNTVFAEDTTVYAHWVKTYTVTFNPNGGTVKPAEMTTGLDGTLSSLPVASRPNFSLTGWFTESDGGEEITLNTVFTEDTIVYAHWERSPVILGTYFETAEELEDWSIYDLDGDDYNWEWHQSSDYAYEGSGYLYSASYEGGALTPDNWAVSPIVTLPEGDSSVSFMARSYSSSWPDEVFAVYAIEADQYSGNTEGFKQVSEEFTATAQYQEYSADLSQFGGMDVRIAIRHFDCYDQWALLVDAFVVTNDNILHTVEIAGDIVGGTVTSDLQEAYIGDTITLSYKADPGYEFVSWDISAEETGEAIEVDENNTFVMPDDNVIVSAVFESTAAAEPVFKATSLLLTGQIGVVFYYDLPQIDTFAYDSVDFTVTMPNGKTETSSWAFSDARENEGMYGFVCYVNSIQMADEITAVLNYTENGEEKTLTVVSSVKEYIENSEKLEEGELTNAQKLTHAVADFGHYAQVYLSDARGWTIGKDYADMDKFYSDGFNAEVVRAAVDKYKPVIEKGENELASISYSLGLDSSTTLYIYANTPSDYTGSITAYCGDVELEAEKVGKSFRFAIPDIKASHLADMYDVIIKSDNERAAVSLAALSYVCSVIDAQLGDKANDAVSAFYYYYAASLPYRMNPRN